jgi:hypothetical protein
MWTRKQFWHFVPIVSGWRIKSRKLARNKDGHTCHHFATFHQLFLRPRTIAIARDGTSFQPKPQPLALSALAAKCLVGLRVCPTLYAWCEGTSMCHKHTVPHHPAASDKVTLKYRCSLSYLSTQGRLLDPVSTHNHCECISDDIWLPTGYPWHSKSETLRDAEKPSSKLPLICS